MKRTLRGGSTALPRAAQVGVLKRRRKAAAAAQIRELGKDVIEQISTKDERFRDLLHTLSTRAEALDQIVNEPGVIRDDIQPSDVARFINAVLRCIGQRSADDASESAEAIEERRAWSAARARAEIEAVAELRKLGQRALIGISAADIRFGSYVQALSATARTLEDVANDPKSIRVSLRPAEIKDIVEHLSAAIQRAKALSLKHEIIAVFNAEGKTTQEAVLYRMGLLCEDPMTLQEAADLIGVTRERIRQIQSKRERLLRSKPYMPVYAAANAALGRELMVGARQTSEVQRQLREKRALGHDEYVTQLMRLSQLRDEQHYYIPPEFGQKVIGFLEHLDRLNAARTYAIDVIEKETKKHGACAVSAVIDALEQADYGAEAQAERLNVVLESITDFETVLHESRTWVRLRGRAYTIANMARKILSVTPRIRIGELRRGLQRHYRVKTVPPSAVLGQVIESELAAFDVKFDGEWVTVDPSKLPPQQVLPGLEFSLYRVLVQNDRVMTRADLRSEMKRIGMNLSSFEVMLGNSPIIEFYGRGIYGLRGTPVTPGQIETLATSTPKTRPERERDVGHLTDGRPYLTRQLGDYELDYRTIHLPSALREYVPDGTYSVVMDGDRTPYEVSVSVNQIRVKSNLFEAAGAEINDYLLVAFDRANMIVEVAIGDREVLSKASTNKPALDEPDF